MIAPLAGWGAWDERQRVLGVVAAAAVATQDAGAARAGAPLGAADAAKSGKSKQTVRTMITVTVARNTSQKTRALARGCP